MPRSQPVPQFVVAGGPATRRAPLRQWRGPGEGAGLVTQNVQVMLEIEHVLAAAVAALVAGNQAAGVPDLDVQRIHPCLHPDAGTHRHRVEIGLHRARSLACPPAGTPSRPGRSLRSRVTVDGRVLRTSRCRRFACGHPAPVSRPRGSPSAAAHSAHRGRRHAAPAPGDCAGNSRLRPQRRPSRALRPACRTPRQTANASGTR